MLIQAKGTSVINTEHLCHFEVDGKKIAFYFVAMTARENWNFEDETRAKAAYNAIVEKLSVTKI